MNRTGVVTAITCCMALASGGALAAPSAATPGMGAEAEREATEILKALIRLDTQNPPGNETRIAQYLANTFKAAGIPYELIEPVPGRASIVARIKGNGSKRALLVMAHEDVVPALAAQWSVDPFSGIERDGIVYGRGAFDDKGMLAANVEALLQLKRAHVPLDRDVIFLAEADEETGGGPAGMAGIIEKYWDRIDCEYALNEAQIAGVEQGRIVTMTVATGEKVVRRARLIAHGPTGHASVPRVDNAVVHLAAAVAAAGNWMTPARLNATTREYFRGRATLTQGDEHALYADVLSATSQSLLRVRHPVEYSMLRTSVVPTMLSAGVEINIIPETAEASLDIRALPDEDPRAFFAALEKVIDDPQVKVVPDADAFEPSPAPSRIDTEMYAALEYAQRQVAPQALTLPLMTTGGSDSRLLQEKGVQTYGITIPLTETEALTHHGIDERVEIEWFRVFTHYLWIAVNQVAAHPSR